MDGVLQIYAYNYLLVYYFDFGCMVIPGSNSKAVTSLRDFIVMAYYYAFG